MVAFPAGQGRFLKGHPMKPVWKNDHLTVVLHKPELSILAKARKIGQALHAMAQETGQPLMDAIDAIAPHPDIIARRPGIWEQFSDTQAEEE